MKRFKWLIWILIIALVAVGIWWWKYREVEQPVVLETEHPEYGAISTSVTATGTIQPVDTVSVGTQVSGTISNVYADFNTTVKKGQLLAELDKTVLEAQVEQSDASLKQAQSNLVYQESNFNRQKQLYDVGAVSKADYETALYNYNTAKESVVSAKASLSSAQRNLSYATVYSPIDGTVLNRNVNVGQTVAASFSTPTLFVIAKDLTKMQVQASVDEADIGNVKKGQRVTFTVDAFPDDTFEGTVKEIRLQPSTSANVVTYTTIIDAPNDDMKLKPGMTASIIIYTKEINDALLVSVKALSFKPDSALLKHYVIEKPQPPGKNGPPRDSAMAPKGEMPSAADEETEMGFVWIKKDSSIIGRPIRIGMNDNTKVEVLSGLTKDDEVITGASQQAAASTASSSAEERSPFLPSPPNRKKNQGGPPPQ